MTAEQFASGIQTACTECGGSFVLVAKYEPRFKAGKPDGETVLFSCPHCGYQWNVAYVSQRGLGVRVRLAEAQERQRAHPSDANAATVLRLERGMAAETRPLSGSRPGDSDPRPGRA